MTAHPFLKWVGGKGKLLPQFADLLPLGARAFRHVEPFVGGGALFFFSRAPGQALLADINPELINAYRAVRSEIEALIDKLTVLQAHYSETQYYNVREIYNSGSGSSTARAAWFVYLNRTCFNGLHRVNKAGKFNVPWGKSPAVTFDFDNLRAAHRALQGVSLQCAPFKQTLSATGTGDFVYLDPPYVPASKTSNFTAYTQEGFGPEDQLLLVHEVRAACARGALVMLSNSSEARELYQGFHITDVKAPRSINSKGGGRGLVGEIVVRNYAHEIQLTG